MYQARERDNTAFLTESSLEKDRLNKDRWKTIEKDIYRTNTQSVEVMKQNRQSEQAPIRLKAENKLFEKNENKQTKLPIYMMQEIKHMNNQVISSPSTLSPPSNTGIL